MDPYKIKTQKEGNEDKEFIENVSFNDIAMFILALIIPSFIKRHYKYVEGSTTVNTEAYKTYDIFYECLYRYSHKRLEAALGIPSVAIVFKMFLNDGVFDNLLLNDPTLSKNQEAYQEARQEFLNIINKC